MRRFTRAVPRTRGGRRTGQLATGLLGLATTPMRSRHSGLTRVLALAALAAAVVVVQPLAMQGPASPRQVVMIDGRPAVAGEVLVKYRRPLASARRAQLLQETDAEQEVSVGSAGARRLRSRSRHTATLLDFLRAQPDVAYAEPNYIITSDGLPDDPWFGQLWGLFNSGQDVGIPGIPGADIDAAAAWDVTTGSRDHAVAIVDSGIDYLHPDLAANIWSAPFEFTVRIGGQLVNGEIVGGQEITCAAGTHGFNAITRTCDPYDDFHHGTHVAGTIGAVGNNNLGVTGVNWTASIMGAKFLDAGGTGSIADAIDAIDFVIQASAATGANVRVLSNSWSGGGFSQALLDQINRANDNDMLFVASAGNNALNNDLTPRYPASYNAPNVIAVASINNRDALAGDSNFGVASVDLAAPGVNVLSTYPGAFYQYSSGTSMAVPHVSGAALLVLSQCPLSTSELKDSLLTTVEPTAALAGKVATGGRLNVNNAIHVCVPWHPDFSMQVLPDSKTVGRGASATYVVIVTPVEGFSETVTFGVDGLPSGASASFAPPSITSSGATLLTVTSSASTPLGSFALTITGTSASLERTATATLTMVANNPPVAVNDAFTTNEDTSLTVNVLANDTDPDGDTVFLIATGAAAHGNAFQGESGGLIYAPHSNYSGPDSFTYTIGDNRGGTATATVAITVVPVNDAPRATNQAASTAEDVAAAITLAATDAEGQALTYSMVSQPLHGALSGTPPALSYTPVTNYNGPDSFTFRANDGTLNSNVGTVSITVTAVNDAPVALPQIVVLDEDTARSITLTGSDVEGTALSYAIVSPPAHGALSGTPPAITYTPSPNYNGADSFTFVASDGSVQSNLATVSITVTPVDEPPPSALAVDVSVSADGSGTVSTEPFSTAGPGEWLIAFVAADGPTSGGQEVTVSGAGLSWMLVKRANTRLGTSEIWRALAGSTITNGVVSSSLTLGLFHQSITVVAFKGAAGVGASATAAAATGAPSVSLVPTLNGSFVYGVGNDWDGALGRVVGPNQAMVHQWIDTSVGDTFWVQAFAAAATAGTPVTLNDTSPTNHQWNFAAVEILPAASASPPTMSCDISAPAAGTNLFGVVSLSARAASSATVAGVRFQIDGANLGAEILNPPANVTTSWDTTTVANGTHIVTCVARDASGQPVTSPPITVTVTNAIVPSVVNRPQSEAAATIVSAGLSVGAVTTAPSTTVPAGSVISQTPAAGTRVAPGTAVALVIATAPPPPPPPPPAPTGLVAAYGFNQTSGTQVVDASGQGNTGTLSGGTWSAAGKNGAALSFTANGFVTIPDAASLDLTSGMTIEAWVRPTSNTGWRTVVLKEDVGGLAYALYSSNGSRPSAYVHTNADVGLNGAAALALNTWTHLAMTYDGATLRMFVNGVQVSSMPSAGAITATSGALRIGGNSVWSEYYRGLIDDVRIYNRALSGAEIQTDMNTAIQ
jgi:subtilisin family serine protease